MQHNNAHMEMYIKCYKILKVRKYWKYKNIKCNKICKIIKTTTLVICCRTRLCYAFGLTIHYIHVNKLCGIKLKWILLVYLNMSTFL